MRVVHLSRRFGHQMSLVAGIDQSPGDALIMMDADLQHPPAVIPELLARFEEGYDVVQTVRRYGGDTAGSSAGRHGCSMRCRMHCRRWRSSDGMADFRLISQQGRAGVPDEHPGAEPVPARLVSMGGLQAVRSAVRQPAAGGRARPSTGCAGLVAFSIAGIMSFSKVPLRYRDDHGFLISALGVLYAAVAAGANTSRWRLPARLRVADHGDACLGGLQLMFLGMLGEYLGSIFDEVKRRPLYVVDEVSRPAPVSDRACLVCGGAYRSPRHRLDWFAARAADSSRRISS